MQARKDEIQWQVPPNPYQCLTYLRSLINHSVILSGCIINVSSLMATKGGLGATAYAASKAGVVGKSGSYCCHVSNFFLIYIKHTLFLYISSCGRKLIFSLGFTRALCREMASRSIRVNALLPGWVNSSMWTGLYFPPSRFLLFHDSYSVMLSCPLYPN